MGAQLWTSTLTGLRRRGTTLVEFREILGKRIVAGEICEPLLSCPPHESASEIKAELERRDFDLVGVRTRETSEVLGFVSACSLVNGTIESSLQPIEVDAILPNDSELGMVLEKIENRSVLFVSIDGRVEGIITLADLNKPLARVYFFGLISLLEMHLGYWIRRWYSGDTWQSKLSDPRLQKARDLLVDRPGLDLIDCLQFGDRARIFEKSGGLRSELFKGSASALHSIFAEVQAIRDDLAHSQYYLSSPNQWPGKISALRWTSDFLRRSDEIVNSQNEEIARNYCGPLI